MRVTTLMRLGAVVDAIRVDSLHEHQVERLRRELAEHGVLIMRRQNAGDAEFVRFLRSVGDLIFIKGETPVDGFPDLIVITTSIQLDTASQSASFQNS